MAPNSTTPDQGDQYDHPFFIPNAQTFRYRVSYTYQLRPSQIEYRSALEVILNLRSFQDTDTITYINNDNGKDLFTIRIYEFKLRIGQLLIQSSVDDVESLYIRLLLTNHYSPSIPDRGYLKENDSQLRRLLLSARGGIDHYLHGGDLFLKGRRMSVSHARAVILDLRYKHDIRFYHINLPSVIPNRRLFREVIRLSIPDSIVRMHTYNHRSEDNILDTPIPGIPDKIIRIINTLIE